MDIDTLLNKHADNYRFHGVARATLHLLIAQSEDGTLRLWGTDHDEHIDNQDGDLDTQCVQGEGYLYVTNINAIEMSYNEFCGQGGMVLVLEKAARAPYEYDHPTDRRQHIVRVEEWSVIGGLRPVFDEDEDIIEEEAFSLEDLLNGAY